MPKEEAPDYLMAESEDSTPNIIYITEEHRVEWTSEATKEMLKLYDEKCDMLETGIIQTQKRLWELVSKDMTKKNFFYTAAQCENKWKTLKRNYRSKLEKIEKFGSCKRACPFETEICEILSKRPNESFTRTVLKVNNGVSDDSDFYVNLNEPPGFSGRDKKDVKLLHNDPEDQTTEAIVLQDSTQLIEELAELKKTIAKNSRMNTQILQQSVDLQSKAVQYFESAVQRDCQRLELEEAKVEQQNEVIKQMKIQNAVMQKMLEKLG